MVFLKRGENLPCHQLSLIPLTAVSVSGKEAVEKAHRAGKLNGLIGLVALFNQTEGASQP